MGKSMNTFQGADFAGATLQECEDMELYLKDMIKHHKGAGNTHEVMWCLSHLSAIRLAILEKTAGS